MGERALPGGADPRVGAVAERDQEGDEVGGRNQALVVFAALAALAALVALTGVVLGFLAAGSNLVLRAVAAFFGRARRSALFS